MDEPKQYPDEGIDRLMNYVAKVVDHDFRMHDHRMRDDVVAQAIFIIAKQWANHPDDKHRNKSAVRFAVLNSIRINGLSERSNYVSRFWVKHALLESDTIRQNDDGETATIFDGIPAPTNYAENARRTLEGMCQFLSGRDLAVFKMMINGASTHEISTKYNVCFQTARDWMRLIITALRKLIQEEYDHAQSAINGLHGGRDAGATHAQIMDDSDDFATRTGGSCPSDRYEPVLGRKRSLARPRHTHRRDPAVVRTAICFNRLRVRLEGRAGLAAMRDLGLMPKSAGV